MKRRTILALAGILITMHVSAQTTAPQPVTATLQPPVSVQSPNTTAFALYGEVPVSYFTGVPDISVPLYTLNEKEITLPLSLNYHASGIRPDVHPGWVGNGWSFSNPGVITRTVHDLPDDDILAPTNVIGYTGPAIGFFWSHIGLDNQWKSSTYMQKIASTQYMQYLLDTEPDEFSFNFGKYSGKFYFDQNGQFNCTDRRLKITLTPGTFVDCPFTPPSNAGDNWASSNNGKFPSSFAGFIVTAEDGTQYVFGGTNSAIEYSMSFFQQNIDYWLANSWYLTKIIGPDGSQVSFSYTRGPMINQMYISLYDLAYDVSANPGAPFLTLTCGGTSGFIPSTGPYDGKLISPLYLKEIDSEQSKIVFNISQTTELRFPDEPIEYYLNNITPGVSGSKFICCLYNNYPSDGGPSDVLPHLQWQKLDSMQVYSAGNNQLLKQFNFTYSSDPTQRLTLLSAQETDGAGVTLPPYSFTYDTSTPLPAYASASVDNWGFSNGQASDVQTVLSGGPANLFTARQANPFYLRAGILTNIVYPTGGTTTFTYEPNTYSQEVNVPVWRPLVPDAQDLTAGGLRIQKITSVDPNLPGQTLTKQYFYYKNYTPATGLTGRSSGVLGLKPQYYFPLYVVHNDNPNTTASMSVFSWQSVLPATENTAGSHIGYSEVEEQDQDGSITQYKFTNYDNGHLDLPYVNNLQDNASPYVPFNSRQLERGKLIGKNIYSATGTLLDAQIYTYAAFGNGSDSVRALKATVQFFCNQLAGNEYSEATAYYNYTYPYLESQMTDIRYDQNGLNPVTTVTNSSYETVHGLLRQKSFTNSKGQTINSKYLYPFDVVPSSVDQTVLTTKPVSYMVNNNIIGQPLQVVNSKVTNGTEQIVSASLTTYQGISVTPPSGTSQITVKPNYNYQLEFVQPPLASGLTNYAVTYAGDNEVEQIDSRFIKHRQFVNYDQRGNIAQYNDNATSSTSPSNTSYSWGYNGLFPVAEIKNAANSVSSAVQSNGNTNTSFSLPAGSTQTYQQVLNFDNTGNSTFTLSFSGSQGAGALASVNVGITGPNGYANGFNLCVSTSSCSGSSSQTLGIIPRGAYTVSVSYNNTTNLNIGTQLRLVYPSFSIIPTGAKEFFYNSFEDDGTGVNGTVSAPAHTGRKYSTATSVSWTIPPGRTYMISYWYFLSGTWKYSGEIGYTGSSYSLATGVATGATAFDDIRIYPKDALMTTYTYDPLIGMTSSTDPKNETRYYEYDSLQRLMNIKDKDGNIIKHIDYHYQGQ
jgi:hypothetical protein